MKLTRAQWIGLVSVLCLVTIALPVTESFAAPSEKATIFVSVASYRDHSCTNTIKDLFAQAEHPERIFVGICEQNTTDRAEACVPSDFKYHGNIRRVSLPHTEAKGPTYARYMCAQLYRDETYFMQIDSHSVFVKHWDSKVIREHADTPSPSTAVLTGYPHDSHVHTLEEQSVPILCDSKFNNDGIPQFLASVKNPQQIKDARGKHFEVPFTSGGFVFALGKVIRDVPFDPYLPHIFQGEEVLYSARLWTHGYDFYTPRLNILFHKYGRKNEKRWHDDNPTWHTEQKASTTRLKRLLKLEEPRIENDPYGLGKKRTIEEYWTYSGLDPKSRTSKSKDKFC